MKLDWTHRGVQISDIRKLNKLYVMSVVLEEASKTTQLSPLFVLGTIFEERLKAYYLREMNNIDRDDILNVNWNMYITQGYYIKIDENGNAEKHMQSPEKWYISYLEIEGTLGEFCSVYSSVKETNKEKNI